MFPRKRKEMFLGSRCCYLNRELITVRNEAGVIAQATELPSPILI